jgi:hypothetical protein
VICCPYVQNHVQRQRHIDNAVQVGIQALAGWEQALILIGKGDASGFGLDGKPEIVIHELPCLGAEAIGERSPLEILGQP